MPLPRPAEARLFYRAGQQRYEDAELLLQAGRTTGAVYLAGYAVECYLKALLLANVSAGRRAEILSSFRGSRAHSIEWLGELIRQHVRLTIPVQVTRHFARLAEWSTDLRYATSVLKPHDAKEFFASVISVIDWADGRM